MEALPTDVLSAGTMIGIARSVGVPSMWEEDAVQEIRIAIWRGENRGSRSRTGLLARTAAIDMVRRVGRVRRAGGGGRGRREIDVRGSNVLDVVADALADEAVDVEAEVEARIGDLGGIEGLVRAIARLPELDRALILDRVRGRDQRETAADQGVAPWNVRRRWERIRDELRKAVA